MSNEFDDRALAQLAAEEEGDDDDEFVKTEASEAYEAHSKKNKMFDEGRLQGTYVIGATGTGKSTYLASLISSNIPRAGVCVLDPHGTILDRVFNYVVGSLEREKILQRIIFLDLTDQSTVFGLNLFACPDPEQASDWVEAILHIFGKIWGVGGVKVTGWGATLEDLLRNIAHTMIANPGMTLAEVPLLLRNEAVRRKLVANVTNQPIKFFWEYDYDPLSPRQQREDSDSTLNKVRSFLTYPQLHSIIGSSQTTIDFADIMDNKKILFVKFDPRRDDMTTLIGTTIVSQLLLAAYSRRSRNTFYLYADEFQKFATEDFATLFAEARKFGVAVTVAHQFRDQLDERNRNAVLNAGNLVVFRISGADAEELSPEFSHTPNPERLERIEEEIIEGEEAIKAVSQNPIDFILHATHMNEDVRMVRETLLTPLQYAIETVDKDGYWLNSGKGYPYGFGATREQLLEGRLLLNDLLVAVMENRIAFATYELWEKVTDIVIALRGFIGFASGIESSSGSNGYGYYTTLSRGTFNQNDRADLTQRVISYRLDDDQSPPLKQTVSEILSLCDALKKDPILVNTGQFQPRKRTQVHYIQHPQRQYSDTKNQVAEELARLPKYKARIRMQGGENLQNIYDFAKHSFYPVGRQIETIKERLIHEGILRRRAEVEEEIRTRQASLLPKPEISQNEVKDEPPNEQKGARRKRPI